MQKRAENPPCTRRLKARGRADISLVTRNTYPHDVEKMAHRDFTNRVNYDEV
jgi:hypothetical protein